MDRVYAAQPGSHANPDYVLEDRQQGGYQYKDDPKSAYEDPQAVSAPSYDGELSEKEEEDTPYAGSGDQSSFKRIGLHALRLGFTITFMGLILAIPLFVTMKEAYDLSGDNHIQNRNFVFWFFVWMEIMFAAGAGADIFALLFPYIFYMVAKWINPAHRRYWRVFRPLKRPFVFLVTIVFGALSFLLFIAENPDLSYYRYATAQNASDVSNIDPGAGSVGTSEQELASDRQFFTVACLVVNNILMNAIFWAVFYLFEKIFIVYISVHYHYRSDYGRIERSKNLINALATLYDTSITRQTLYGDKFQDQDIIIRDAVAAGRRNRRDALRFFQRIGGASGKVLSAFGNMLGSGERSHWLKPGSTYAIVEHALEKPASAKALAQRIWLSLVPHGESALTKEHIAGAFNLDRKHEAEKCLIAIDENENGDVRLTEMEPMLVEAGKTRLNVYRNMQEINHAINTLDWILCIWIALFMLFVILVGYVPFLKDLKEIFGFVGLGLGVAIKSVVTDFILGCVFIFFKHPYDIGDRIDLYNIPEAVSVGVIVKRISLLYCVFERTDTGATVQFPNSLLWLKRIENLSRSGQGLEKLTMTLNIKTSFKDLEYLQNEMKTFLSDSENSRDYKSNVALRVQSINELDKMNITMNVTHKSNWSNDDLKSARSSRLYCRLIEIARMVPLYKPGGGVAHLGDEGKPSYLVVVSEDEAAAKRTADKTKSLKKRHDFNTVDITNLDEDAKREKEDTLKVAEAAAYKGIASIPATMAGRPAERPDGKVFGQTNTHLQ